MTNHLSYRFLATQCKTHSETPTNIYIYTVYIHNQLVNYGKSMVDDAERYDCHSMGHHVASASLLLDYPQPTEQP